MQIKRLTDHVSVSAQIQPSDIDALKAAGFAAIVNNRPDGEEPGQPTGAAIEAAAKAAGLAYYAIPMGRAGVTPEMISATRTALGNHDAPVFCYCRSGTRSTTLWALAQAGAMPAGDIVKAAAGAGYDMSHLLPHLG